MIKGNLKGIRMNPVPPAQLKRPTGLYYKVHNNIVSCTC